MYTFIVIFLFDGGARHTIADVLADSCTVPLRRLVFEQQYGSSPARQGLE